MTRSAATALVVVALVGAVWGVLHVGWFGDGQIVDYGVYQTYGDAIVHEHQLPYRDFAVEYPPAAIPLFALPATVDGSVDYTVAFQAVIAVLLGISALLAAAISGLRAGAAVPLLTLALGSVVVSRFDFWPAALTIAAMFFVLRERHATSAVFAGTAFAAKLWPAVVVPVIALWLLRNHGRGAAARWVAATVATAAAWFVPFLILSPGGVAHSFHEQFARPLQIESLGSSLLIAVHHLTGSSLHIVGSFGSQNVAGPGAHALAIVTSVVGVAALLAVYVATARSDASDDDFLRYCAAAVAVTIAFGKVFSPQFVVWLVVLVPVVRGLRGAWTTGVLLAVCVLTQSWFPHHYWELATSLATTQSLELLVRNLLVVALAAMLVWPRLEHEVLGEHRARVEALQRVRAQID